VAPKDIVLNMFHNNVKRLLKMEVFTAIHKNKKHIQIKISIKLKPSIMNFVQVLIKWCQKNLHFTQRCINGKNSVMIVYGVLSTLK
jgi:hypothetical protein